eukprot:TRINITY_DN1567_c2_g1_i5.p2 TRINITY_DN1567_c2_g1~~TRINITY_DN1567_c2_g1_i5.p2  ORF type:complete len:317 (-),score=101.73 TRINITY_DN1567_c2_g1_i5:64-1014(-)
MSGFQLENVKPERKIGSGAFGDVYVGTWSGEKVALKKMKEGDEKATREFLDEINTFKEVVHSNIVQYLGTTKVDGEQYIVMEWMSLGSLGTMVSKINDMTVLLDIARQCAAGMIHLAGKKIIHRDLALRNVLLTSSEKGAYVAKIADFGMSRITEKGDYNVEGDHIPIKWCAPEILQKSEFSTRSDAWAFGILLWELFTAQSPYPNMTNKEAADKVCEGYHMDPPSTAPQSVQDLMLKLWSFKPEDRPTFETCEKILRDELNSHGASSTPMIIQNVHNPDAYVYTPVEIQIEEGEQGPSSPYDAYGRTPTQVPSRQ